MCHTSSCALYRRCVILLILQVAIICTISKAKSPISGTPQPYPPAVSGGGVQAQPIAQAQPSPIAVAQPIDIVVQSQPVVAPYSC